MSREIWNRVKISGVRLLDRVIDRLYISFAVVKERDVQIISVTFLFIIAATVTIVETTGVGYLQQILSTAIAGGITLISVYLSIDALTPYAKSSERTRIAGSEAVVAEYSNDILMTLKECVPESVEWSGEYSPIAAAVETTPETHRSLDQVEYELVDDMYQIPDDLGGVIEPVAPQMQEIFQREGYFSGLKPRLNDISDDVFKLSKTTYYRSFQTNFCPDLNLGAGFTLRDVTKSELVDNDGVRPLRDSPFSNHLGAAGLVVSADGATVLSTRSSQVAVDQYAKSLSFSGSLALEDLSDKGNFEAPILQEMTEELNIPDSAVKETVYLGTTRRMERLGKPDILTLVLVEEVSTWENPTEEFRNLDLIELESEERIESVSQLCDPEISEELIQKVLSRVDRTSRHASTGLLSFLALYSQWVRK